MRAGERPEVLVYAFILDFLLRLLTIRALVTALKIDVLAPLVPYVAPPPDPDTPSYAPVYEETRQPIRFSTYILVVTALAAMAFVLVNVGADKQLHIDAAALMRDVRWSGRLAVVYWVQALVGRTITIDPAAPTELNLGYNARDIAILAFAVLAAGAAVAWRQTSGMNGSGWVVLAPLIVVRFLFDVARAFSPPLKLRRTRDPGGPARTGQP
jgi:hypothetical protein